MRVSAVRKRERLSIQSQWWWTIRPKYINVLQQEYSTLSEFSFNPKSFLYYIKSPEIIDNNIWMGINVLENYFIREQIMQFSITNLLIRWRKSSFLLILLNSDGFRECKFMCLLSDLGSWKPLEIYDPN